MRRARRRSGRMLRVAVALGLLQGVLLLGQRIAFPGAMAAPAGTGGDAVAVEGEASGARKTQPVDAAGPVPAAEPAAGLPRVVHRALVKGPITPATVDYLRGAMAGAVQAEAAALVVILDTPGGLLESTKLIVQDFLGAPLPVLVHVWPGGASATSAGVFLTMAAHVAAMAPGSSIGAAHPVGGQGKDIEGDMGKKVENFVTGFGTAIAERRGRNVEWAEKAVRESVTATENEAVANRIVDFVAVDLADLLAKASGREVELSGVRRVLDFRSVLDAAGTPRVVDVEMTLRQRVVAFVSDPNIAYLLMMGAMLGLYVEFSNPGLILPGVAGAICLLLALLAAQVLPISSTGALLMAVGMAFVVAEMFFPSFGALGVGGVVALALGSLFLYTPESALAVDRRLVASAVGTIAAAAALVIGLLVHDRRRRPSSGIEGMIGCIAVAVSDIQPTGRIRVRGEIWNARSKAEIRAGDRVRITGLTGLEAEVVPDPEEEGS